MADSREHDRSCPICLAENTALARSGSCGHSFCTNCLHQYFALPSSAATTNDSTEEEEEIAPHVLRVLDLKDCNIDGIATVKGCPMCRCPMSLLELKHESSQKSVWRSSSQQQLENTPLAGKTYATTHGIGYNSFHFPPFSSPGTPNLPYFLWEEDAGVTPKNEEEPISPLSQRTKHFFQPGCFYFAPKRSFQGQILLPDAHGTLQPYDVLLDFAADHRWITGGLAFRRPERQRSLTTHPLEGRWKVTWYSAPLPPDAILGEQSRDLITNTADIHVVDNSILDAQSMVYRIRYEADRIYFHWPGFGVTQTLDPVSDFRSAMTETARVPAVGDYLRWITTDTQQPYIVWQRDTIVDPTAPIKPNVTYFGRSGDRKGNHHDPFLQRNTSRTWYREWLSVNNNIHVTDSAQLGRPPYYKNRLWGNTFCQGLRVGLASYHFGIQPSNDTGDDEGLTTGTPFAYISYEHDMCSQWPLLDDGSPIPPQVYFHDITLEMVDAPSADNTQDGREVTAHSHYVFRGNIEWLQDYRTTWQNNLRWEYEMHFDSEFTCIVSGTVHSVAGSNESSRRQELSQFGTDLVYVNAGILNAFDAWMNEDDLLTGHTADQPPPRATDDIYPRYTNRSRALRRRLQAEGASVRTVAMLNMIFTHSMQPGSDSPIDYNT